MLKQERVSVTCEISPGRRERWWLTKESGQLPAKCEDRDCWTCGSLTAVEVKAYVAVKVETRVAVLQGRNHTVFFAPLRAYVLDAALPQLLRRLENAGAREDESAWESSRGLYQELESALYNGEFCGGTGLEDRFSRWEQFSVFAGVFPSGRDVFFTGITDAVGRRWSQCSTC